MTLRNLALPVKVLYTCILVTIGTGYFFALTYLFLVDVQPHAQQGHGMIQGVVEKYYGKRDVTALEASLEGGGMGEEVTPTEKAQLLQWVRGGADEAGFADVAPIFANSCAACHNHEDMPGAPLTTFEEVSAYTAMDTGTSAKTLVRVSHIHVFGMTFIFTIVSGIFVQSEAKSGWRAVLVAIPFLGIWFDIGSWWVTRVNPVFAVAILIGGALVGLSMALQIFLSFYEMWLLPPVAANAYQPMQAPATAVPPGAHIAYVTAAPVQPVQPVRPAPPPASPPAAAEPPGSNTQPTPVQDTPGAPPTAEDAEQKEEGA